MLQGLTGNQVTINSVSDALAQLYGERPELVRPTSELNPHTINPNMLVYCASFGSNRKDRIIKISGEGDWKSRQILLEQMVMIRLRELGFCEVPEVEFTQSDLPLFGKPYFTIPRITPGKTISDAAYSSYDQAAQMWRNAGSLRARIGAVPPEQIGEIMAADETLEILLQANERIGDSLDRIGSVEPVLYELIDWAEALFRTDSTTFGQYDPAEIIDCENNGLAIIDFSGCPGVYPPHFEFAKSSSFLYLYLDADNPVHGEYARGYFGESNPTPDVKDCITVLGAFSLIQDIPWLGECGLTEAVTQRIRTALERLASAGFVASAT